jgi:hypothetical protein
MIRKLAAPDIKAVCLAACGFGGLVTAKQWLRSGLGFLSFHGGCCLVIVGIRSLESSQASVEREAEQRFHVLRAHDGPVWVLGYHLPGSYGTPSGSLAVPLLGLIGAGPWLGVGLMLNAADLMLGVGWCPDCHRLDKPYEEVVEAK